jgi:hypothetical protein
VDSGQAATLDVPLRPTTLSGRITDADSGAPLQGVIVRVDLTPAATDPATTPVEPTATAGTGGRAPGLSNFAAQAADSPTPADATTPAPPAATDTAVPPTAIPPPTPIMPQPRVKPNMILAVTDADGRYTLENVPDNATLTLKMPGYELTKVTVGQGGSQDVALKPFEVKALYMTAEASTYDPLYSNILKLIDTTELNAVVVNIQTDPAEVAYDSQVPLVISSNGKNPILSNVRGMIQELHDHHIYVIARMMTFMQPKIASANPGVRPETLKVGQTIVIP